MQSNNHCNNNKINQKTIPADGKNDQEYNIIIIKSIVNVEIIRKEKSASKELNQIRRRPTTANRSRIEASTQYKAHALSEC